MDAGATIDFALSVLGGALCALGLCLIGGGCVAVLRFPDFYTRLHAASVICGAGAFPVVLGLLLLAPDAATGLRLGVLAVLMAAIAPMLLHMSASGGHGGGLAPLSGKFMAPRPNLREARRE